MQSDSLLSDVGPGSGADSNRARMLGAHAALVPLELHALGDADLIAATRALHPALASYAWAIVLAATVAAALAAGATWAIAVCVIAIIACKVGLYMHERSRAVARAQLAKRELCARYHIGSIEQDEAEANDQLREDDGIERIVLFRAWALPHGGHRFVRIALGRESRIAMYATPFLSDLHRHPSARGRMMQLDLPLSQRHEERLRKVCSELTPQTTHEPELPRATTVGAPLDGLPCAVVVLGRDMPAAHHSMDFRGIASLHALSPAERLVSEVLEIEAEVTGTQRFEPDSPNAPDRPNLVPWSI
jgi:hypothetical protein